VLSIKELFPSKTLVNPCDPWVDLTQPTILIVQVQVDYLARFNKKLNK